MKASYLWIKDHLNFDLTPEKTSVLLTDLGLEVEGVENYKSIKGGLEGVVVGEVLSCTQHENADKLKVTTVNIGSSESLQIVCGAPNVATGQKVPVATIGTTLYDKEGVAFKIKKGKIRGVVSMGMICAEDELGLGDSHEGILILPENTTVGLPLKKVFKVTEDSVFEIGLTPNRCDAMGHYGIARDVKAGLAIQNIKSTLQKIKTAVNFDTTAEKPTITVKNPEKAPRYAGVFIEEVKVAPSPKWLAERLQAIGLNPINNIVDITNYILHDLAQPLHAFDVEKIKGREIIVQTLPKNTPFVTLDGTQRKLHEDDLMICDGENNPMCLAGIFGGKHSGVTNDTTAIFLESAYFDPINTRKSAKRHALHTDASFRFERGIDPDLVTVALKKAVSLILEIAGGKCSEIVDHYPTAIEGFKVVLAFQKINKLIGHTIKKETIKSILENLDIKILKETDEKLTLKIPAYRNDVTRPEDVIEEILRVYGYNNIDFDKQISFSITAQKTHSFDLEEKIAQQLCGQGFYEMLSNSLTAQKNNEIINDGSKKEVTLINPLSADLVAMRLSLLNGMLETIAYNYKRQNHDIRFYEFGKTYEKNTNGYNETNLLALAVTKKEPTTHWKDKKITGDFFYLKGIVEAILSKIGIENTVCKPTDAVYFSEGIDLFYEEQFIACIGSVTKKLQDLHEVKPTVFYAEIDWDILVTTSQKKQMVKVTELHKFPAVKRDFSLLVPKEVSYQDLYILAKKTDKKILQSVHLTDVYYDKKMGDKQSYMLTFILQDVNKTLSEKQINKTMQRIQKAFENNLNVVLRS